jgi:predicted ATPase
MTQQEARQIVEHMEEGKNGERLNIAALSKILPWIGDAARPGEKVEAAGGGMGVEHVCDTLLKLVRFAHTASSSVASMFIIEDVQWMDYESLDLLMQFLDGTDKVQRIAIFLTFRTDADGGAAFEAVQEASLTSEEDAAPPSHNEKERRALVTQVWAKVRKFKFNSLQLALQPLPKNEASELAVRLLGGDLNEISANKLWEASKGDPFHIEMLSLWLLQQNQVRSEKSGQLSITSETSTFPKTSNDLIKARVASLSADAQRVLQLGSSGGEHFDAAYILAVHKALASAESKVAAELSTTHINDMLKTAAEHGIVVHREDKTIKDDALAKWTFKHDLVYRAVWLSVASTQRALIDKVAQTERTKLNKRLRAGGVAET